MEDRELLELAAKAYWGDEIDDVCSIEWDEDDQCIAYTHGDNQDHNGQDRTYLWNPLEDAAAALLLAVKLGMSLHSYPGHYLGAQVAARYSELGEVREHAENHGEDLYAATRRAIVRAAAAIGKSM